MSSRFDLDRPSHPPLSMVAALFCLTAFGIGVIAAGDSDPLRAVASDPARELRVCADPNNLPFSDRSERGFDNEIAGMLARELHATLSYTWQPQRRGFLKNTLNAHRCDIVFGVPTDDPQLLTTQPYYRSTYVFVQRAALTPVVRSLNDARLQQLRIGIHVIGDDYNSLPSGVALAQRGLVRHVSGYSIYGDYAKPSPPHLLIEAVETGAVDVAIAWGPLAGYYALTSRQPLVITPIPPQESVGAARFVYDIAIGVRPGDDTLHRELDSVLVRHRAEIDRILDRFGVPRLPTGTALAVR